jgi:hypothetical protein
MPNWVGQVDTDTLSAAGFGVSVVGVVVAAAVVGVAVVLGTMLVEGAVGLDVVAVERDLGLAE